MSNTLAISAVTLTLRSLLTNGIRQELNDIQVTTLTPDKARGNNSFNQLNLFLYQTMPNAAWRNQDMPRQVKPGERGYPPLPLNLYYLITAYGQDNEVATHRLLAHAMSILHDHPVLTADEIKEATKVALPGSDLHQQLEIEKVRFTYQPLSLEEISKLWASFQTSYRLSVAYEAAVVLIESTLPVAGALPVLRRGDRDQGVDAQAEIPRFPVIEKVRSALQPGTGRPGDTLTITGDNLRGDNVVVRFANPRLPDTFELVAEPGGTAKEIRVNLPETPAAPVPDWLSGLYSLVVVARRTGEADWRHTSNELAFALAPVITNDPPATLNLGDTLTLNTSKTVLPEQRVAILLGDREIRAEPHTAATTSLDFVITGVVKGGEYYVRLRVDGADSILLDPTAATPSFDPKMKVKINE